MLPDLYAIHATDLGERKTDSEIWEYAKQQDLVIITKDPDFYDRVLLVGPPPSIVWVRVGNMKRKELENMILLIWNDVESFLNSYALIEITSDGISGIRKKWSSS